MNDSRVAERITVGLIGQASEDLAASTASAGLSKTDVVNRAISMYAYLTGMAATHDVLVRDKATGELTLVRFL